MAVQTAGWDRGTWGSGPWGRGLASNGVVGAATLTGAAPSLITGDLAAPTVGAVVLAGIAPTITNRLERTPASGVVNINGLIPDVYPRNITTLVGAIAIGSVPPVATNFVSKLVTGSVTMQGVAPIISDPNWIIIDTDQTPDWKEI